MGVFKLREKIIKKADYSGYSRVDRKQYTILEFSWSDFSKTEQDTIYKEADILYNKADETGANTGLPRDPEKKYIDSLSGVIAEFATTKFFNEYLNDKWNAKRPIVTTTHNQVDIALTYKDTNFKVEVRSSFVQNGIEFALYSTNREGLTYFDVLGTYKQTVHKKDFESVKDLFMRVLFDINGESSDRFKEDRKFYINRKHFINKYINKDEPFYIIGGMSGEAIERENYTKNLSSKDLSEYISDITEGEYHVSQISKISDIKKLSELR